MNTYYHITFWRGQFHLHESSTHKVEGAHETLEKIKRILKEGLVANSYDYDATLSKEALHDKLLGIARKIKAGYSKKVEKLNWLQRYFSRAKQALKHIEQSVGQIENRINPPRALEMPDNIMQNILTFLSKKELGRVAQINRKGREEVKWARLEQAQEMGYEGKDPNEAVKFIRKTYRGIRFLYNHGHLKREDVVWADRRKLDARATYQKIRGERLTAILSDNVEKGNLSSATWAFSLGGDPTGLGAGFLDAIIQRGSAGLVRKALSCEGVDVNGNHENVTPLLRAIDKNAPVEIIEALLEAGADPNGHTTWSSGVVPLYMAVSNVFRDFSRLCIPMEKRKGLIRLLLEKGADPNYQVLLHRPICYGIFQGTLDEEMLQLLLDHGADPTLAAWHGKTALHYAAQFSRPELVSILLNQAGVDPTVQNVDGKTPRDLAPFICFKMKRLLKRAELSH